MPEDNSSLAPGEAVLRRARPHWSVFSSVVFWAIVSIALLVLGERLQLPALRVAALVAGGLMLLAGIVDLVRYFSEELTVTSRRLILRKGLLHRNTSDLSLLKIEAIHVEQTLMGRIFGYGTLIVSGTGGVREFFPRLRSPMEVRRVVHQQLASAP